MLKVIDFFLKPKILKKPAIIGGIIAAGNRRHSIKSINQKPFRVEIRKTVRARDFSASFPDKPLLEVFKQSPRCVRVINAFKPAETAALVTELFFLEFVYNPANPSDRFSVLAYQQQFCVGNLKTGIAVGRKKIQLFAPDLRHVIFIVAIKAERKINPFLQFGLRLDFNNR